MKKPLNRAAFFIGYFPSFGVMTEPGDVALLCFYVPIF
jgi:hypothetical protein